MVAIVVNILCWQVEILPDDSGLAQWLVGNRNNPSQYSVCYYKFLSMMMMTNDWPEYSIINKQTKIAILCPNSILYINKLIGERINIDWWLMMMIWRKRGDLEMLVFNHLIWFDFVFQKIFQIENERIIRANDPVFNSKFHYAVSGWIFWNFKILKSFFLLFRKTI